MKKLTKQKILSALSFSSLSIPLITFSTLLSSCKNQNSDSLSVSFDNELSYTKETTFKVQNPVPDGSFIIRVNDKIYDPNSSVPFFNIQKQTNSELILQPLCNSSTNTYKYTVEYSSKSKTYFSTDWFLSMGVDFTLKVISQTGVFNKITPKARVEAINKVDSKPMSNISWSYELIGAKATSFLEYFNVTETTSSTSLTLIKDEIPKDCDLYVTANNDTGKVLVRFPVQAFLPITSEVNYNTALLDTVGVTTASVSATGSYIGKNLEVAWDVYTPTGQPLNLCKKDYYEGGILKYKKNEQVPLTTDTFEAWKKSWINHKKNPEEYPDVELYGEGTLEFLFADGNNSTGVWMFNNECGIYNSPAFKNGFLKLKLNPEFYIPSYKGIKLQAKIYTPTGDDLLAKSEYNTIPYDTESIFLDKDITDEKDLYFPNYTWNEETYEDVEFEGTDPDSSIIKFRFSPYVTDDYTMEINKDEPYTGFQGKIHTVFGSDSSWTPQEKELRTLSGENVGKWLLGDYNDPDEIIKPSLTDEVDSKGNLTGRKILSVPLKHQLFLPVNDESGKEDETRSVQINIKINVLSKNTKEIITTFPIPFVILNSNRIINVADDDFLVNNSVLDIYKVAEKYKFISNEDYRNELYFPTSIKRKGEPFSTNITGLIKSETIIGKDFFPFVNRIKHVSFQKGNKITTFLNAGPESSLSADYGVFSGLSNMKTFDLTNCKNLKRIERYSCFAMGDFLAKEEEGTLDTVTEIFIPESVTEICEGAFSSTPLLKVNFVGSNKASVTCEKEAFAGCRYLFAVNNSQRIQVIGPSCFSGDADLSEFDFSTVEEIYEYAFKFCSSLTNIDFSGHSNRILFKHSGSTTSTDYYYFSCNFESVKSLAYNINFAGNEQLLKNKNLGEDKYFNLFSGDRIPRIINSYNISTQSNETDPVTIAHLGCPWKFWKDETKAMQSLPITKLTLWHAKIGTSGSDFSKHVYIVPEDGSNTKLNNYLIDLGFDGNSILNSPEGIIFSHSEISNIKFLNFGGNTQIFPVFKNFFVKDFGTKLSKIQAFTYVANEIDYNQSREDYSSTIKSNFFPSSSILGQQTCIPFFACLPQDSILTINIKMSRGPQINPTDLDSAFDYLRQSLIDKDSGIFAADEWDESGKPTHYIHRMYNATYDVNTSINWFLY